MNKEQFINEVSKLNINLTDTMLTKLEEYYKILVEENDKYNLTAITDKNQVYLKHFYDSITLSKIINLNNQSLCDIGTGAGFPGLVLKISYLNRCYWKKMQLLKNGNWKIKSKRYWSN